MPAAPITQRSTSAKPRCVIVVPIVSNQLSALEQVSLSQLIKVLGQHPIVALAPERLRGQLPIASGSLSDTFFVDDAALESIASYNQLMLSPDFYRYFSDSDYMLIHQLDAFVFRDELRQWTAQAWDYIGPPWAYGWAYAPLYKQLDRRLKAWWSYQFEHRSGTKNRARYHALRVGNGGFSLRRIDAMLDVLSHPPKALAAYRTNGLPDYPEDLFWGVDANRQQPRLRVPDWSTALRFGVESAPSESLAHLGGTPFGCHAWYKLDLEAWRPHIAAFGHQF